MTQPRETPILKISRKNKSGSELPLGVAVKTYVGEAYACDLADDEDDDPVIGLVSNAAIGIDEIGDIITLGVGIGLAGGTVTEGDRLMVTTGGQLITLTASAGDNVFCVGIACQAAEDDELFEVLLAGPSANVQIED